MVIAEKAQPKPLPAVWKNRLGRYKNTDPRGGIVLTEAALRYKDGLLLITLHLAANPGSKQRQTVVLQPVTDADAVVHGLGRNKGDTVQFREQAGELLMSYTGFVLRRVE